MLYQTHARIHLGNIRQNLEQIRLAVGPERKIMIAVKANAYGHGAVEVSRMAERIGIELASHVRAAGADRLLYGLWAQKAKEQG